VEYGTTFAFLEYFGLSSLDDLPDAPALPGVEDAAVTSIHVGAVEADAA
jgi:chromosome segregation and condensation protein ScpB